MALGVEAEGVGALAGKLVRGGRVGGERRGVGLRVEVGVGVRVRRDVERQVRGGGGGRADGPHRAGPGAPGQRRRSRHRRRRVPRHLLTVLLARAFAVAAHFPETKAKEYTLISYTFGGKDLEKT